MKCFCALLLFVVLLTAGGSGAPFRPNGPVRIIENKTFKDVPGTALRLENEKNVIIRNCVFENVGAMVCLINCHHVQIKGCTVRDLRVIGIDIREGCTDIHVVGNHIEGFQKDVQGGHLLSMQKTEKPRQRRIYIRGNTFVGPGKSFVRGKKVGATGDMVAMRSVTDFQFADNTLVGGGEFGLTCLYGSRRGTISSNHISRIDGTGLLIGYDVGDIEVIGNKIIDCGMSYETDGSANDITHQSGIHCRNGAHTILIADNIIRRERAEEMHYGIHLREASITLGTNSITGINENIHIPRFLKNTVSVSYSARHGSNRR